MIGQIEYDPDFGVDRLETALLRFAAGQATFASAGQLVPYQKMQIFGTTGRIEAEIPFNTPPDRPARIFVDDGSQLGGLGAKMIEFPAADQYALQAERFIGAVRGNARVPVSIDEAIANMAVIDALVRSATSHRWEQPKF